MGGGAGAAPRCRRLAAHVAGGARLSQPIAARMLPVRRLAALGEAAERRHVLRPVGTVRSQCADDFQPIPLAACIGGLSAERGPPGGRPQCSRCHLCLLLLVCETVSPASPTVYHDTSGVSSTNLKLV